MQQAELVVQAQRLARQPGRLGERPAGHQLHACLLTPGRTPGAIRLGPAPGARSSAPNWCGCSRGHNHAHNGTQWPHPSRLKGHSVKPKGASVVSILLTVPLIVSLAGPAGAASSAAGAAPGICASSSHPALAGRISRAVEAARRDRVSFVAVEVDDPGAGLLCRLDSRSHFDSASVVKVIILGALLRKAQAEHRSLTRSE